MASAGSSEHLGAARLPPRGAIRAWDGPARSSLNTLGAARLPSEREPFALGTARRAHGRSCHTRRAASAPKTPASARRAQRPQPGRSENHRRTPQPRARTANRRRRRSRPGLPPSNRLCVSTLPFAGVTNWGKNASWNNATFGLRTAVRSPSRKSLRGREIRGGGLRRRVVAGPPGRHGEPREIGRAEPAHDVVGERHRGEQRRQPERGGERMNGEAGRRPGERNEARRAPLRQRARNEVDDVRPRRRDERDAGEAEQQPGVEFQHDQAKATTAARSPSRSPRRRRCKGSPRRVCRPACAARPAA